MDHSALDLKKLRGSLNECLYGFPIRHISPLYGESSLKEAAARIKINKILEAAGWRLFPGAQGPANILLEANANITIQALDELGEHFEKARTGFIDFLLLNKKSFPFIVLEAKAEDKNPLIGKEQARKYAKAQNCRVVILSNGNLHYFGDLERGNPYVIQKFPTPTSVAGYQESVPDPKRLVDEKVWDDYIVLAQRPSYAAEAAWKNEAEQHGFIEAINLRFLRSYQNKAIFALQAAVMDGRDRFLFEMATGTGKTLSDDYLLRDGDILFVRSNGNPDLVGHLVIVPPLAALTTFSGFTIRGRILDERALAIFYAHFFKSRDFAKMIKTVGQGANIRNLSQGILNELAVPSRPLPLRAPSSLKSKPNRHWSTQVVS